MLGSSPVDFASAWNGVLLREAARSKPAAILGDKDLEKEWGIDQDPRAPASGGNAYWRKQDLRPDHGSGFEMYRKSLWNVWLRALFEGNNLKAMFLSCRARDKCAQGGSANPVEVFEGNQQRLRAAAMLVVQVTSPSLSEQAASELLDEVKWADSVNHLSEIDEPRGKSTNTARYMTCKKSLDLDSAKAEQQYIFEVVPEGAEPVLCGF